MRSLPIHQARRSVLRPAPTPRDVVLVNPPFQPLNIPATGISHIASATAGAGHRVRVADLNYPLANLLVDRMPALRTHWERGRPDHVGQLLFSSMLFEGGRPPAFDVAVRTAESFHGCSFGPLLARTREFVDEWVRAQDFDRAEVVGLTLLNYQLLAGLYLVRKIREAAPRATIVAGGFYVSAENGAALLSRVGELDCCVFGEGELSFLELLDALDRPDSWPTIAGLVCRDPDGTPRSTPKRPLMRGEELDQLPYADYGWVSPEDQERWEVSIPIVSVRGCFWGRCTFCSDFQFNRTTYARSAEHVVGEMTYQAERHRTGRFYFSDLATNDTIERVVAISRGLAAAPRDYNFMVLFVPNNVTLPMLRDLAAAGCAAVQYGIESLSNSLLKKMAKANTCLENVRCIKLTELAGMQAVSNIIKFFPRETLDEVADNHDKILRFPEVFNGYVFDEPVEFHVRAGSGISKYTAHHGYALVDRAIHELMWPPEWSRSIPDIDWQVEHRSEDAALHRWMWRLIAKALADNLERRRLTRYQDDGAALQLTKYRHVDRDVQTVELTGDARRVYLAMEDATTADAIAAELELPLGYVQAVIEHLAGEDLVFVEGERVIGTIHRNVSSVALTRLITTVENARETPAPPSAPAHAAELETAP